MRESHNDTSAEHFNLTQFWRELLLEEDDSKSVNVCHIGSTAKKIRFMYSQKIQILQFFYNLPFHFYSKLSLNILGIDAIDYLFADFDSLFFLLDLFIWHTKKVSWSLSS